MSDRSTRLTGLYSVVAAALAVVVSPLLALSYFATSGGVQQLGNPTVSAWAVPARRLAGGLLTWASPERVYGTYWLTFWVLFSAVYLCARAVHARRPDDVARLERWGWRMVLVGYALGAVGGLSAISILVDGTAENVVIDVAFVALMLPAIAIDAIGSTVLGVALLRSRYRPRITAWLLVLALPAVGAIPFLLGNFSLGLTLVVVAWATTGWRLWRGQPVPAGPPQRPLDVAVASGAR